MQKMMQQAQKMQEQVQKQIAELRVEVSIDPEAMEDREMLQDMLRGAVNEAAKRVDDEAQSKMSGLLGGMGLPPGMF